MLGHTITVPLRRMEGEAESVCQDLLAVEEPLEIRVNGEMLAVTMRTPGADAELAAGFLFSESLFDGVERIDLGPNLVDVRLRQTPDLSRARRAFTVNSACGVCGRSSINQLAESCEWLPVNGLRVERGAIYLMPDTLRAAQPVFERTGALHAAGLFDASGNLEALREDVGRHNALDKLIGAALLAGRLPLSQSVLLVSGRASFELVQKAVMAGIPVMAAVGAPSSLAVATALRFNLTLAGFVRGARFNVYSAPDRLAS